MGSNLRRRVESTVTLFLLLEIARFETLDTINSQLSKLETITATVRLIAAAGAHEYADLLVLTTLRFWGEVLVSVEYGRCGPGWRTG